MSDLKDFVWQIIGVTAETIEEIVDMESRNHEIRLHIIRIRRDKLKNELKINKNILLKQI